MIVAGARLKGLICSLTRSVHFRKSVGGHPGRHQAAGAVDALPGHQSPRGRPLAKHSGRALRLPELG